MKIYLNDQLLQTAREPEKFRTPENLLLQCLIFWIVFFVMQLIQGFCLLPKFWNHLLEWGRKQIELTGTLTTSAVYQETKQILLAPNMLNAVLYATIAGTIVILLFCRCCEGRKFRTMGFTRKNAGIQYLSGIVIGFILFSCVVGLTLLFGGLHFEGVQQFSPAIFITLLGFGFQGMSEEVTYRGYCMTTIMRNHSVWWAVGLNSLFFGLAHASNDGFSAFALFNLVLYAVMISLYTLRMNSLWGACAIHSIWNFAQGNFYGLPVSGIDSGVSVFKMSLTGSDFINGGAFGLEAGLATTIVMTIAICILLFMPIRKAGEAD